MTSNLPDLPASLFHPTYPVTGERRWGWDDAGPMVFRRELIGPYLLVGGGLLGGILVGVFVVEMRPAVLGWLFGAGAGLMLGAFIAAIASNEPLVGRSTLPPAEVTAHLNGHSVLDEETEAELRDERAHRER